MRGLQLGKRVFFAASLVVALGGACNSLRQSLPARRGEIPDDAGAGAPVGLPDAAADTTILECPAGQHTCPGGCVSDIDPRHLRRLVHPLSDAAQRRRDVRRKVVRGDVRDRPAAVQRRLHRRQRALRGRLPRGPARLREPLPVGPGHQGVRDVVHGPARSRPARPRPPATAPSAISRAPRDITSAVRAAPSTATRPPAEWRARPVRPIPTVRRSAWAATARWRARPAITCAAASASATVTWAAAEPRRAPPVRSRPAARSAATARSASPTCPAGT